MRPALSSAGRRPAIRQDLSGFSRALSGGLGSRPSAVKSGSFSLPAPLSKLMTLCVIGSEAAAEQKLTPVSQPIEMGRAHV